MQKCRIQNFCLPSVTYEITKISLKPFINIILDKIVLIRINLAEIRQLGREANIHIFVFCIITLFSNRLFLRSVNMNIGISPSPNHRSSAVPVYEHLIFYSVHGILRPPPFLNPCLVEHRSEFDVEVVCGRLSKIDNDFCTDIHSNIIAT